MSVTAIVVNAIAIIILLVAFAKDRKRAVMSLKIAAISFVRLLPMLFVILIVIGLILGFVTSEQITKFVGEQSGVLGVLMVGVVGSILHIPSLLSFPLAASLLEKGASISAVAAFITTLTMIGTVTLPLEIKELGKEMALSRNGLSFIIAIAIALIMGAIL
ncbi:MULTISPECIES: permease [unclassified Archaeoglobus]|jgi:uncharacterized membrane protein YraQ (UPF0718 family)|uniref:permease n=1 Tax=unclassified Archaeoglobus TaxID=2643606 RepID=UPI0025BA15F9|nr:MULTISPECIES: permease [unclassified Archaeoglobus]